MSTINAPPIMGFKYKSSLYISLKLRRLLKNSHCMNAPGKDNRKSRNTYRNISPMKEIIIHLLAVHLLLEIAEFIWKKQGSSKPND